MEISKAFCLGEARGRRVGRVFSVLLLAAGLFLAGGCGEIRYSDSSHKYRVGQDDGATAKYIERQGGSSATPATTPARPMPAAEPQAPPPPPPPLVLETDNILFDFDRATIRSEFLSELDEWAKYFAVNPVARAQIIGHTDSTGPENYNQKLSERRAQAVADYLVGKGIDPNRITTIGFGESQPVVPNTSDENRQKNRRVELHY
jgi:outer membrane protein OmpA-like peptidoglycan-associated protein